MCHRRECGPARPGCCCTHGARSGILADHCPLCVLLPVGQHGGSPNSLAPGLHREGPQSSLVVCCNSGWQSHSTMSSSTSILGTSARSCGSCTSTFLVPTTRLVQTFSRRVSAK